MIRLPRQGMSWVLAPAVALGGMLSHTISAQEVAVGRVRAARASEAVFGRLVTANLHNATIRQAVDILSASANVRIFYREAYLATLAQTITWQTTRQPLGEALNHVLQGTGLYAEAITTDAINIKPMTVAAPSVTNGIITGTVIDAQTRRPLSRTAVALDDANAAVLTNDDGTFRLSSVSAGVHSVHVRRLGYVRATQSVTVDEGRPVSVTIALEPSVNALDQVVVTGTIIPTELKAVPNAITVITAKQIEARGITKIDQLFRGDVPGIFAMNLGSNSNALLDEVTMFSRGATALSSNSVGVDVTTSITNPIKTYVDGVELADSKYLSQIDPKSIERIEILTGPQASTIYGSNAINGVMQIFTKRGTSNTPQLTLNLLSGWVENNFSSARTPQHDYSAQLSGVEGRISYNAGGSWNYIGPWTPAKQSARTDGFGGARLDLPTSAGRVTVDMSLRRSLTQSLQRGDISQTSTVGVQTGQYSQVIGITGLVAPTTRTLTGQTLGLTLTYVPVNWWSHELEWGQDVSDTERRATSRGYRLRFDTTLFLRQDHADRRSLRYASTARIAIASLVQATVTAGADAWQNLTSLVQAFPQTLTGSLTGSIDVSRQPGHNAGAFLQSQLGFTDRFFLTYGLRAEWNPNYGAEAQPNYAPRYGMAYVQDINTPLGAVTGKLRASYGRSTRPPGYNFKAAWPMAVAAGSNWTSFSAEYAPFDYYLANPDLVPEHQQGGEGGMELYFGTRGSLVITRYNQTVDGLIDQPIVDSVRSLMVNPTDYYSIGADGYGYWYQYQYLNIGSIRNQGWELQGSTHVGPITTQGTYSWTKSRTLGVNPRYRAYFANQPQYQPGATFAYLPEHTWALGMAYTRGASNIGLNVMGVGRLTNNANDFLLQHFSGAIRLPQNRLSMNFGQGYVSFNHPYALADFNASHRIRASVEALLQVQNLMNRYTNDLQATYASLGRQIKVGARVRTQ